jgi:hypothetical protein
LPWILRAVLRDGDVPRSGQVRARRAAGAVPVERRARPGVEFGGDRGQLISAALDLARMSECGAVTGRQGCGWPAAAW